MMQRSVGLPQPAKQARSLMPSGPERKLGMFKCQRVRKRSRIQRQVGEHASKKALNEVKKDTVMKKKKKEQSKEKGANQH